jgi:CDP-paratose 2-epimerase
MKYALITGSAGLVGSAAAAWFARKGWQIIGVDNDQRQQFFGPAGSTRRTLTALKEEFPAYTHVDIDIRDNDAVGKLFATYGRDIGLVIHAAAQPSHDWAATAPLVDFQVNALATLQLLEHVRKNCPEAVFVYASTNKVYGDAPNSLSYVEHATRWELEPSHEYAEHGVTETMSVDQCLHSLFGCSKLSADVIVQEYGRYFGLKTGCFRCGCITGGAHAAVEQHGFLAYVMRCAVRKQPYVIHGYQGKQVRDNIHADDLVAAFEQFALKPRPGEVYNMGGSRHSNCSVLEAVSLCEKASGNGMSVTYDETARRGDHIWWISDVRKFQRDYPEWTYRYDLNGVVASVYDGAVRAHASEQALTGPDLPVSTDLQGHR